MFAALFISALFAQAAPELTVYVFTTTDCPISNRYAPEVERLSAKFKGQARFVLVYPVKSDTPDMIREHAKKFAYSIETLRDVDQKLVKLTAVTVTPEAAVMKGAQLLYRGRIDDRYIDFGKDRPAPTRRDLEVALSEAVAGKPVAVAVTRAVGCILADLVK